MHNFLADQINDGLNVLCLLLFVLGLMKLVEIDLWEESLHDLNKE